MSIEMDIRLKTICQRIHSQRVTEKVMDNITVVQFKLLLSVETRFREILVSFS